MGRSRIDITGGLNSTTPFEVLELICDCHGISMPESSLTDLDLDRIVQELNSTPQTVDEDFETLARFANTEASWDRESLDVALKHLEKWCSEDQIPEKISCGYLSPECPEAHDPTILYRLCQRHGVQTSRSTSSNQMKTALEAVKYGTRYILVSYLSKMMERSPLTEIASLMTLLPEGEFLEYSVDKVLDESTRYDPKRPPQNHEQAVIAAGSQFHADISSSRFPLEEYKVLEKVTRLSQFVPKDPEFAKSFCKNRKPYDLRKSFNPKLPPVCYRKSDLDEMALCQGFTDDEIGKESAYSLIQSRMLQNNFYRYDPAFVLTTTKTVFQLEEISTLPPSQIFCYGILGGPMSPFSLDDLLTAFEGEKQFSNPRDRSIFPDYAIHTLSRWFFSSKDTKEKMLNNLISKIQKANVEYGSHGCYIQTRFRQGDKDFQPEFCEALDNLLRAGMCMRGWNEKGPYPLASLDTKVLKEDEIRLSKRVGLYLATLIEAGEKTNSGAHVLLNSPLMRCSERDFVITPYKSDGTNITIRQRIDIIWNNHGSSFACIRSSSNYFLTSVWFYSSVIGNNQPFDLKQMSHIA